MADISDSIGLEKPFESEKHSVDMINRNYKRIDDALGKLGSGQKPFDSKATAFLGSAPAFKVSGDGASYVRRIGNWGYWKIDGVFREKVGPSDTGNIGNTLLCNINAEHRPAEATPLGTLSIGPDVSVNIGENGNVDLTGIPPGYTFNVDERLIIAGWGVIL